VLRIEVSTSESKKTEKVKDPPANKEKEEETGKN
jgi:hypothetical protein